MSQHTHTSRVAGCYRCELGADEAARAMTTTDNLTARLAEIRARAEAATEGPWEQCALGGLRDEMTHGATAMIKGDEERVFTTPWGPRGVRDMEFIARARQDVPTLLAALEAVVNEHKATIRCQMPWRHTGIMCDNCREKCWSCDHFYPCPTITAVTDAIGDA